MFDDDNGGRGEFRDAFIGCVRIVQIVVGEFLALDLRCGGDAGASGGGGVEGGGLVGVFAIAQHLAAGAGDGGAGGIFLAVPRREPGGDGGIIGGGARVGLRRQRPAGGKRGAAMLVQFVQDACVVLRRRQHRH
jgi:hypothetical protein